jgi:hypothetical protein
MDDRWLTGADPPAGMSLKAMMKVVVDMVNDLLSVKIRKVLSNRSW